MESYVGAMRSYCRVLDEKILLIKRNKILVLCAIALSLDRLFCYILVVHDDKKCLGLDRTLRTIAIVSRSVIDFLYILRIIFQFCATRSVNPVDLLAILPLPQVLKVAVLLCVCVSSVCLFSILFFDLKSGISYEMETYFQAFSTQDFWVVNYQYV